MTKKMTIVKQTDKKLLVSYWRKRFEELKSQNAGFDLRDLRTVDEYFFSSAGKATLENVKRGVAGLVPTMQVVTALDILIKKRAKKEMTKENVLRKQKLVIT